MYASENLGIQYDPCERKGLRIRQFLYITIELQSASVRGFSGFCVILSASSS